MIFSPQARRKSYRLQVVSTTSARGTPIPSGGPPGVWGLNPQYNFSFQRKVTKERYTCGGPSYRTHWAFGPMSPDTLYSMQRHPNMGLQGPIFGGYSLCSLFDKKILHIFLSSGLRPVTIKIVEGGLGEPFPQ